MDDTETDEMQVNRYELEVMQERRTKERRRKEGKRKVKVETSRHKRPRECKLNTEKAKMYKKKIR